MSNPPYFNKFKVMLPLLALVLINCQNKYYHDPSIDLYYRPEMAIAKDEAKNYSKSPLKPRLFMQYIKNYQLLHLFQIQNNWQPFQKQDFYIAHTQKYVDGFFAGKKPYSISNELIWTPAFADSVRYTNASLYAAIKGAIKNPQRISLSPSSGFHHAQPDNGAAFCTFSGQVIASIKIFREMKKSGAYFDLDGHFGNSIGDTRTFVPELNQAIPSGGNINPKGYHSQFIKNLAEGIYNVEQMIYKNKIHYIVLAHGTDSHIWDDLGGQCNTNEWLHSSQLIFKMITRVSAHFNKPFPLILTFFGGYRADDYNSVLNLHTHDALLAIKILSGKNCTFPIHVKKPSRLHSR